MRSRTLSAQATYRVPRLPLAAALTAAAIVAFVVARVHESILALAVLRPASLSIGLALFLALPKIPKRLWSNVVTSTTFRFLGFVWLFAALSIPGSAWPGGSIAYIIDAFVPAALVYLVVATTAQDDRAREYCMLALLAGIGVAAIAAQLGTGAWPDGRFGIGYTLDPNMTAALFVLGLPFTIVRALSPRSLSVRIVAVAAAVLIMLGILKTGSRGGLVGAGVVLLMLSILFRFWKRPVLILLGVAVSTATVSQLPESVRNGFAAVVEGDEYNLSDSEGRLAIWRRGIGYAVENPVLGVGVGAFRFQEGASKTEQGLRGRAALFSAAHNFAVEALAELGFFGGSALIFAAVLSTLQCAARVWRKRIHGALPRAVHLAVLDTAAASSGVAGVVACGLFLSLAHSAILYFSLGVATAMAAGAHSVASVQPRALPLRPRRSPKAQQFHHSATVAND
jgi:O-antigen ligase